MNGVIGFGSRSKVDKEVMTRLVNAFMSFAKAKSAWEEQDLLVAVAVCRRRPVAWREENVETHTASFRYLVGQSNNKNHVLTSQPRRKM